MFINYTGTNVHALPQVNVANPMLQSPQDVKWLRPGWNEFPKAVWDQNKSNPNVQKMLKKGIIKLLEYTATVKVKTKTGKIKLVKKAIGLDDSPVKLKYFDEKTAVTIAKNTYDRDLLQRWDDEETRHKVKKVLRKQIEPLMSSKDDEDEDDYGGVDDDFDEEDF